MGGEGEGGEGVWEGETGGTCKWEGGEGVWEGETGGTCL